MVPEGWKVAAVHLLENVYFLQIVFFFSLPCSFLFSQVKMAVAILT